MEIITSPPDPSSFTPLSDYLSQTPASFVSGPPVLHYMTPNTKLKVGIQDAKRIRGLREMGGLGDEVASPAMDEGNDYPEEEIVIHDVDVWVTSENLIFFVKNTSHGLKIPYQQISLHAIQAQAASPSEQQQQPEHQQNTVYMQVMLSPVSATFDDYASDMTAAFTIVPLSAPAPTTPLEGNRSPEPDAAKQLFFALSACADLHPDVPYPDSENDNGGNTSSGHAILQGGNVSLEPGSSGWITAENAHEFFTENGEFRPSLGQGAGRTRNHEEANGDGAEGEREGDAGESDETKWRRTE